MVGVVLDAMVVGVGSIMTVVVSAHVPLVLSAVVFSYALLSLSIGVATVVQLAERGVEDPSRDQKGLAAGLHTVVGAVAL